MNFSVPNINSRTVLEFLTAKGWRVAHVGAQYAHLLAPEDLSGGEALFVPLQKGREEPGYGSSVNFLLRRICEIYQIDQEQLKVVLSASLPRLNAGFMAENKRQRDGEKLIIKDIDRY